MAANTLYVAKKPDTQGSFHWTKDENQTWKQLVTRQIHNVQNKACDEYLSGLEMLNLPVDRVPQLHDINRVLEPCTGWRCKGVPALISFDTFFELLASKQFPVATFIRSKNEMDYLQEPDIFHEIFCHCAMLTHPAFADFTQKYGQLGLHASHEDRVFLARLYWFTVEFGLLTSKNGYKIYGGGILSSPEETEYAYSNQPQIKPFDVVEVLRTPYRIDIIQPIYFVIDTIDTLFSLTKIDLMER
ncbi:phenylalanine 4-monooxygenase [Vibrio tapetis]|uniref:phenylalanine 4-monooxygenase n=1 Tax=Vibrio tapetis subsp. tapetis TaxID=1671868 RepID=A0A2N8ZNC0_9VIBR|nr:Phenylalanine-4-hydroxylase [Vibrio tapetis subsp. tapetis]